MIITANSKQKSRLFVQETSSSLREYLKGDGYYRVMEIKASSPCLERVVQLENQFQFSIGVPSFEKQMELGYLTRKLIACFKPPALICLYVIDEPYRYCFFKYHVLDLPRIDINCASLETFLKAQLKLGIRPEDVVKNTQFERIWGGQLQ